MNQFTQFNQEDSLQDRLASDIIPFWQQGQFSSFLGVNEVSIHYAFFLHEDINNQKSLHNTDIHQQVTHKEPEPPTIVIVPGRCEGYLKYQELAFDLYHQGYNIFILDHRGQGLSDRLLPNLNKGYVNDFQDYVADLGYFVEHIVMRNCSTKPYLLAHSMGGAIAVRFMQDSPVAIKAAVIASPMLGFHSGLIPTSITKKVIAVKLALNKLMSNDPWYFWGQKDYAPTVYTKNKLTHSTERYRTFVDLYTNNKQIQLGGVTTHWLMQGIIAQNNIFSNLAQLKTPILLLQAGGDKIVCQQAQVDFCRQLHKLQPQSCPGGLPIKIDDAYHELFFESDHYRNEAIQQTLTWFKQHTS